MLNISVGVAQLQEEESLDACIARADVALFAAKGQGRDNVLAAVSH
jgi:PleD family two-component response regulator